jgi:hypothetical protein
VLVSDDSSITDRASRTLGRKRILIPLVLDQARGDLIEEAVLFVPNS